MQACGQQPRGVRARGEAQLGGEPADAGGDREEPQHVEVCRGPGAGEEGPGGRPAGRGGHEGAGVGL